MTLPEPQWRDLPNGRASYLTNDRPARGAHRGGTTLLLHGGGLDRASLSWRHLFPVLAEHYRVVAPDWPGYGDSTPFDRSYTIADLGRWLITLMDSLDIDRADLVGISMGGGAALWIACHHPDRVRRLVPVATYGVQDTAPMHFLSYCLAQLPVNTVSYAILRHSRWAVRRALDAIFADPHRVTEAIVDEVHAVLRDGALGEVFSGFQRGEIGPRRLRTVLTPELSTVSQPALFIHGKADSLVPLDAVRRAVALMPSADLAVLDAGHWPMREQPDAFNRLVTTFLAESENRAKSDQTP